MSPKGIIEDLEDRGMLHTCTNLPSLSRRRSEGPIRGYCGFDPTADSLHVGSLLSLAALRLWTIHGHDAVALVGGFTGMIGDPSGKSRERTLMDVDALDHNRAALTEQIRRLLTVDGREPTIVDNRTWFEGMSTIDFLREVGKLVPVADMLERDSVRLRLEEGGLSFTEFAYQVLQAHDFAHLRATMDCELQLGGSDQYGNICAGIDMIRRRGLGEAWGVVWPLLAKADGTKFGKTESGNVWLSAQRTTPFQFHQFWFNAADADVRSLLAQFTLLSIEQIDDIVARHNREPSARVAQRMLADEVTAWVHGAHAAAQANRMAAALVGGVLRDDDLDRLAGAIPTARVSRQEVATMKLVQLASRTQLCASVSEARRLVEHRGLYAGGTQITDQDAMAEPDAPYIIMRRGARNFALVLVDQA
jgi:tyrosyl-tRNA synthetase